MFVLVPVMAILIGIFLSMVLPRQILRTAGMTFLVCSLAGFFLLPSAPEPYLVTSVSYLLLFAGLGLFVASALRKGDK